MSMPSRRRRSISSACRTRIAIAPPAAAPRPCVLRRLLRLGLLQLHVVGGARRRRVRGLRGDRRHLQSAGGEEASRARALGRRLAAIRPSFMSRFRGRLPTAEALLKRNGGFLDAAMTQRAPPARPIEISALGLLARLAMARRRGFRPASIGSGRQKAAIAGDDIHPAGLRRSGKSHRFMRAAAGAVHAAPSAVVTGLRRAASKQRRGSRVLSKPEMAFFHRGLRFQATSPYCVTPQTANSCRARRCPDNARGYPDKPRGLSALGVPARFCDGRVARTSAFAW